MHTKEEKLAAALIFLAQGTPFINGGQEFMRTKRGNANSYMAPDIVNQIDISMKEKFSDVYNTYKALISFRKANKTEFGANENASAQMISPNVVKYVSGKFTVYFNSNSEPVSVSDSGKIVQINEKDGTYSVGKSVSVSFVPEKSFVIIQK